MRIGEYEVLESLGMGAWSVVYRVRHRKHHDPEFALKLFVLGQAPPVEGWRLFVNEVAKLRDVGSRRVAGIHEFGEHEGSPFVVLDHYPQGSLERHRNDAPLRPERVVTLLQQIGQGLDEIHDRGILHCDVKPANIMCRDGEFVLADFGVGRFMLSEEPAPYGTAPYTAPECFVGIDLDRRVDLFALGMVAYEFLLPHEEFEKRFPVTHLGASESLDAWRRWISKPGNEIRVELPRGAKWLTSTIESLICSDRDQRMPSADRLLATLDELDMSQAEEPSDSPVRLPHIRFSDQRDSVDPVPAVTRSRPRLKPILIGSSGVLLAILLVAVILVWAPWRDTSETPTRLITEKSRAAPDENSDRRRAWSRPSGDTLGVRLSHPTTPLAGVDFSALEFVRVVSSKENTAATLEPNSAGNAARLALGNGVYYSSDRGRDLSTRELLERALRWARVHQLLAGSATSTGGPVLSRITLLTRDSSDEREWHEGLELRANQLIKLRFWTSESGVVLLVVLGSDCSLSVQVGSRLEANGSYIELPEFLTWLEADVVGSYLLVAYSYEPGQLDASFAKALQAMAAGPSMACLPTSGGPDALDAAEEIRRGFGDVPHAVYSTVFEVVAPESAR